MRVLNVFDRLYIIVLGHIVIRYFLQVIQFVTNEQTIENGGAQEKYWAKMASKFCSNTGAHM